MNPEQQTTVLRNARFPRALLARSASAAGEPVGDLLNAHLLCEAGRVCALISDADVPVDARCVDVGGRIIMPCLTEPHVHLDKCHTISRLEHVGGDLLQAIEAQAHDQHNWTEADIRSRAGRGVEELIDSGCHLARTHIDWPEQEPPLAWHVLGELARDCAPALRLQRAALIDLACCDDVSAMTARARVIAADEGVLGIYLRGHAHVARRLNVVFDLAERFSLPLDFHVDEDTRAPPEGLSAVVKMALERKFGGPLLCGHACGLLNVDEKSLQQLIDDIARAAVSVVALPSTNLYLQGRTDTLPATRGMTPVKQLDAGGVRVAFGADNVADAFCPGGLFDPFMTLALAALVGQLDPPYGSWLGAITSAAEEALGAAPQPIERARLESLLVVDATSTAELLRLPSRCTASTFLSRAGGERPNRR